MREFQMTVDELLAIPTSEQTERQKDFIRYYHSRMPVSNNDCVMNRILQKIQNRSSMVSWASTTQTQSLIMPS